MRRKRRIVATVAMLIFAFVIALLCWDVTTPIPLKTAIWQAPKPISNWWIICDLDGDGDEEVITEDGWHLWLKRDQWQAEKVPLKKGETVHWSSGQVGNALLILGSRDLWLMVKRKGWQRQKLAERLRYPYWDAKVTDLDGDGRWDDILILAKREVIWFKVTAKGQAIRQDALRLSRYAPMPTVLIWHKAAMYVNGADVTIFAWQGRLRWVHGDWWCQWSDMNGDGKPDLVRVADHGRKISALLAKGEGVNLPTRSTTATEEICLTLTNGLLHDSQYHLCDLDGDGRMEIWGKDKQGHPVRLWLEGMRWQQEQAPFQVKGYPFETMGMGKRDWLLFRSHAYGQPFTILTAIRYSKTRWQQKVWRFWMGRSVMEMGFKFGREQGEWTLTAYYSWSPQEHPFWGQWLKVVDWLRQKGLPVPQPWERYFVQVWQWDERRQDWRLTERWEGVEMDRVDLDGNGQTERIITGINLNRGWVRLGV